MKYQILQINQDFISGAVKDNIANHEWIVVTDIPRQMVKFNRVQPLHISLIHGETDESFSKGFKEEWIIIMAKRFRNWLLTEHPEKLYPYKNEPIAINYNVDEFCTN